MRGSDALPEAHRLAQATSRTLGRTRPVSSKTRSVSGAHTKGGTRKAGVEELLAIADRAAAHVRRSDVEHAQLFYDENGLPT
jgi:antitoxin VapB